jgi:hypothetical protein
MQLVEDTPPLKQLNYDDHDALVVVGGQSPTFTFRARAGLAALAQVIADNAAVQPEQDKPETRQARPRGLTMSS